MTSSDKNSDSKFPHDLNVPKWFEDITERASLDRSRPTSFTMENVFHRNDIDMPNIDKNVPVKCNSARFGRRASITSQILASASSTNTTLSDSKYLIPKVGDKFSMLTENQDELERQWKGLTVFEKSHKGRLDSASDLARKNSSMDYGLLTPFETYSHNSAPNSMRSKSEMSSHDCDIDNKLILPKPINKSHSSENVIEAIASIGNNSELKLNKHLNEYKLNCAREDILRKEIIKELLAENKLIADKIKKTNTQINNNRFIKSPSYDDIPKKYLENYKSLRQYKNSPMFTSENSEPKEDFDTIIIPELPSGKVLVINILSTWGDKHYVGLNGIEIFGDDGKLANIAKITASPQDITVLPECKNDPRVITNLLDGVNRTQDDVHLWLAPFEKGEEHTITITFVEEITIAMIRIWNYNKSRIHSYRGVKDVIISLDQNKIFKGEIAKACGGIIGGLDAFGDTILFTLNDEILGLISQNDESYKLLTSTTQIESPKLNRPPTASLLPNDEIRPFTGIQMESTAKKEFNINTSFLFGGNSLKIFLLSNWGNKNMIGLTGIEVIDDLENTILIDKDQLQCSMESIAFSLERLINGKNLTINPEDMWCIPYDYEEEISVTINFSSLTNIKGIRIWNYNESLETTYAGVSRIRMLLDNQVIVNPLTKTDIFLVRRAPGNVNYDFVQDIYFQPVDKEVIIADVPTFKISHHHKEEFYECPMMPEGFVVQFIIYSTWGDQYYCGLDEIEMFDHMGRKILLDSSNICAYPESINVLSTVEGDVRTPDKLIDGITEDLSGRHSWLAPIIPKSLNRIYIVFDQPMIISIIKLWNYSKTPSRGVKEFGILVDDLLIYNGVLDKHSPLMKHTYRTIAFTDDANVLEQELETLIRCSTYGQEVVMLNENKKCTTGGSNISADPALRPFTSISPVLRKD